MDSTDVRAIGICGMGGIGKTTIAKTFYNQNANKFDISCFHENFEQYSQGVTSLLPPLEQLLIDLLRKKNYKLFDVDAKIRKLKQILHTKKALIVLDDLDQTHYPILLASLSNFFSAGSRIIITTRDADLLNKLKVVISEVEIYMVHTLGADDSLKLFSYHAFRKSVPPESFRELSLNFVTHAGGLPLALKVLGSSLLGKTHYSFWKEKLEKVRAIPENNIQKILQLSYDELDDDMQKAIFLDIAFFFIGKDKDVVTDVFKSSNFFPGVGIPNLVDKCLLTIDEYNRFEMHNLILDMGRELGKTTRLFLRGNAWKELQHLEPIKQLNYLSCLYLRECHEMKRLPEQLGDLKALKKIDASFTAIEKLPNSITHLKNLVKLKLRFCRKLTQLPEQLGEIKALKKLDAGATAIKQLPDSFVSLINLEDLDLYSCKNLRNLPKDIWKLKLLKELMLNECSNLEQLPEQLGKMQCLEWLHASGTAIEQVPDSIGLLSRLRVLHLFDCKKLRYVPPSIWNLISVKVLSIHPGHTGWISLPDSVKNMKKLKALGLSCNVRLCLPKIQCFSSLERLSLTDEGQILSSAQPFSLSELFNLRYLYLRNCTSLGSSLPELPLNLQELKIYNHISLEQLPDLSSLRKLTHLYVMGCISLRSMSLLPSHLRSLRVEKCTSLQELPDLSMLKDLRSLSVEECTSLQELPDLSMLKELEELNVTWCNNLKAISLEESFLHVGQHRRPFEAHLPNREVAEWLDYKSSGCTVSFDIPPSFGSNFSSLALWVVYTCKASKEKWTRYMRAVITNDTEGITENYPISVNTVVGEAQSTVHCIAVTGEEISMKSGDRIEVSIPSLLYSDYDLQVRVGEVKVNMIGVHVLQDRPSTSVY